MSIGGAGQFQDARQGASGLMRAEAADLDQTPLGARSFRLQQVYGAPAGWTGQKVAAKGFLTRFGAEERVNVTSMRVLSTPCSN